MMGQTLERLFEQKVLTMPKEVSSTVQYNYTIHVELYPIHIQDCVCGVLVYVVSPSWIMLTMKYLAATSGQQVLFSSLIVLTWLGHCTLYSMCVECHSVE